MHIMCKTFIQGGEEGGKVEMGAALIRVEHHHRVGSRSSDHFGVF